MNLLYIHYLVVVLSSGPVPAMPSPPQTKPDVETEDIQLDPKSLAGMLDNDPFVRSRLRYKEQGKLLRWPVVNGVEMVGQIAMPSIALNVRALRILAKYWCPKTKEVAKSPGIDLMRAEAGKWSAPKTCVSTGSF